MQRVSSAIAPALHIALYKRMVPSGSGYRLLRLPVGVRLASSCPSAPQHPQLEHQLFKQEQFRRLDAPLTTDCPCLAPMDGLGCGAARHSLFCFWATSHDSKQESIFFKVFLAIAGYHFVKRRVYSLLTRHNTLSQSIVQIVGHINGTAFAILDNCFFWYRAINFRGPLGS
jgi:hypothetical protein